MNRFLALKNIVWFKDLTTLGFSGTCYTIGQGNTELPEITQQSPPKALQEECTWRNTNCKGSQWSCSRVKTDCLIQVQHIRGRFYPSSMLLTLKNWPSEREQLLLDSRLSYTGSELGLKENRFEMFGDLLRQEVRIDLEPFIKEEATISPGSGSKGVEWNKSDGIRPHSKTNRNFQGPRNPHRSLRRPITRSQATEAARKLRSQRRK